MQQQDLGRINPKGIKFAFPGAVSMELHCSARGDVCDSLPKTGREEFLPFRAHSPLCAPPPPQVAIKSIRKDKIKDEQDLVHIRREIEIMSSLNHPHIIAVHEGEASSALLSSCIRHRSLRSGLGTGGALGGGLAWLGGFGPVWLSLARLDGFSPAGWVWPGLAWMGGFGLIWVSLAHMGGFGQVWASLACLDRFGLAGWVWPGLAQFSLAEWV